MGMGLEVCEGVSKMVRGGPRGPWGTEWYRVREMEVEWEMDTEAVGVTQMGTVRNGG